MKNSKQIYFISPHLDDAFFSCGALMLSLLAKDYALTVVNIFTRAGEKPETLSAKKFLQQTGGLRVEKLTQDRVLEDKKVLVKLGVQVINLNEVEALWRKKEQPSLGEKILGKILPEFLHTYPVYRLHATSGRVAAADKELVNRISSKIAKMTKKDDLILCPVGIGGHVDHMVVKEACQKLKQPVIFWADIPYNKRTGFKKFFPEQDFPALQIKDKKLLKHKNTLAQGYNSQYFPVFGAEGCSAIEESYYDKSGKLQAALGGKSHA